MASMIAFSKGVIEHLLLAVVITTVTVMGWMVAFKKGFIELRLVILITKTKMALMIDSVVLTSVTVLSACCEDNNNTEATKTVRIRMLIECLLLAIRTSNKHNESNDGQLSINKDIECHAISANKKNRFAG